MSNGDRDYRPFASVGNPPLKPYKLTLDEVTGARVATPTGA